MVAVWLLPAKQRLHLLLHMRRPHRTASAIALTIAGTLPRLDTLEEKFAWCALSLVGVLLLLAIFLTTRTPGFAQLLTRFHKALKSGSGQHDLGLTDSGFPNRTCR